MLVVSCMMLLTVSTLGLFGLLAAWLAGWVVGWNVGWVFEAMWLASNSITVVTIFCYYDDCLFLLLMIAE